MMTSIGLYTDVIGLINDYCSGDRAYWKRYYDQVVFNMNCFFDAKSLKFMSPQREADPFLADMRKMLCKYLRRSIRRKIRVIINFAEMRGDGRKTVSITDTLYHYKVVGIHRVAFDRAVRRINQIMRLTEGGEYMYNMNVNSPMLLEVSRRLFRHLQDYNYTEYVSIFNCRLRLWAIKMDWGTGDVQTQKRAVNKEIREESFRRVRKRNMIEQETENTFAVGYSLDSGITIINVNHKSISVNVSGMTVNKKVGTDKNTGRVYICNPVVKRRRLYADEKKYIE